MKMGRFEKRFVNSDGHSQPRRRASRTTRRNGQPETGAASYSRSAAATAPRRSASRTRSGSSSPASTSTRADPDGAAAANGVTATRFLVADATRLPFADGEFDLVYTNKTTHHIRDWQQALTEMIRVLKPEGHLLY